MIWLVRHFTLQPRKTHVVIAVRGFWLHRTLCGLKKAKYCRLTLTQCLSQRLHNDFAPRPIARALLLQLLFLEWGGVLSL